MVPQCGQWVAVRLMPVPHLLQAMAVGMSKPPSRAAAMKPMEVWLPNSATEERVWSSAYQPWCTRLRVLSNVALVRTSACDVAWHTP